MKLFFLFMLNLIGCICWISILISGSHGVFIPIFCILLCMMACVLQLKKLKEIKCIPIFDSSLREYGGFNHFLAGTIFRWKLSYLDIYFEKEFKFEIIHKDKNYYYDGYHNHIWLGYIIISYGT